MKSTLSRTPTKSRITIACASMAMASPTVTCAVRCACGERNRQRSRYPHIPQTNPVVTKLTSLALEAIDRHGAELVVGFYLEPYAVAAYLAATLSGRPLVIRHAGSDVGRLLSVPQLGRTYTAILKSASLVCARPAARARFLELGVPESRIAADPGWTLPRDRFHPGS